MVDLVVGFGDPGGDGVGIFNFGDGSEDLVWVVSYDHLPPVEITVTVCGGD